MTVRNWIKAISRRLIACSLVGAALSASAQDTNELLFQSIAKFGAVSAELERLKERLDKIEVVRGADHTSEIADIRSKLKSLEQRISTISTVPTSRPDTTVTIINGQRAGETQGLCPSGQVLTGLSIVDTDGGKYCTTCISGVRLRCSRLLTK